ncbi:hypothetical protein GCM10007291_10670 [Gemmobacter nanjingensis]|jgi:hypothetical protein|uniref:Uncharacterized protein n=1 Tax=Gemmobacter nanjingensis TaxID=488454 RepID=A0ABQ3F972_9RHOB|nr:hypothetical protein [Gemmobacter nanjingensis]GHC14746.1 hypothetical protein GCM10007291_10670 [Gemmobacter nanjingensis]
MSRSFAQALRTLFSVIALAFVFGTLGGAGLYYLATGNGVSAALLAAGGLALVITLFGMLALQIENNRLLHRIADAAERQARHRDSTAPATAAQPAAPALTATRAPEAPVQPAAPRQPAGRVEPVMTLRRAGP